MKNMKDNPKGKIQIWIGGGGLKNMVFGLKYLP
jgi:hypothetical protein